MHDYNLQVLFKFVSCYRNIHDSKRKVFKYTFKKSWKWVCIIFVILKTMKKRKMYKYFLQRDKKKRCFSVNCYSYSMGNHLSDCIPGGQISGPMSRRMDLCCSLRSKRAASKPCWVPWRRTWSWASLSHTSCSRTTNMVSPSPDTTERQATRKQSS